MCRLTVSPPPPPLLVGRRRLSPGLRKGRSEKVTTQFFKICSDMYICIYMLFSTSVGIEGASSEDNKLKPGRFLFYNCAIETTFSQFIFLFTRGK